MYMHDTKSIVLKSIVPAEVLHVLSLYSRATFTLYTQSVQHCLLESQVTFLGDGNLRRQSLACLGGPAWKGNQPANSCCNYIYSAVLASFSGNPRSTK